ncbi:hypothetical protein WQQ_18320 [Hydrocarboniphaga effusa AP103]|uniref:Uncharacterized protein n=1 Tax=Hydrocarboniphaga effusa AP103 TaxID=1172194 RepID=I8TCL8_9GAMM|nr:hypothetical protein WQQ_18320 [Hydrocarboniphaga effusa AP103]
MAAAQGVQGTRFAGVGSTREGDLGMLVVGQLRELRAGEQELSLGKGILH